MFKHGHLLARYNYGKDIENQNNKHETGYYLSDMPRDRMLEVIRGLRQQVYALQLELAYRSSENMEYDEYDGTKQEFSRSCF